jgi:acyl-CoA thioesterase
MDEIMKSKKIVQKMFDGDAFSQWLGICILEVRPGYCKLAMKVRKEMTNGFYIAHGGITYSLADSALAFASNGYGPQALSIETSVAHHAAVKAEDVLTAEAEEISQTKKLAWYHIRMTNQEEKLVASFKGTVYRTGRTWDISD